jgi:hypothetical protein
MHAFTYTLTDGAGNESGESPALNVEIATAPPAVVSLDGTSFGGQLINPVTVSGRTYYYWDRDGSGDFYNGLNGVNDYITHNVLDTLFNGGDDTTNLANTVTVINSAGETITLRLPKLGDPNHTDGGTTSLFAFEADGIAAYTGLLDIWDEYNDGAAGTPGLPSGWASSDYWSATSTGSGSHAYLQLDRGYSSSEPDGDVNYVALEVV